MLWFLIIGSVAGLLTGVVRKARGTDFVGYVVVGITGASVAGMFAATFGAFAGQTAQLIASVVGAAVLLSAIEVIKKM